MNDTPDTKQITIRDMPVDLWLRIKAEATIERKRMRDKIIEILTEHIKGKGVKFD